MNHQHHHLLSPQGHVPASSAGAHGHGPPGASQASASQSHSQSQLSRRSTTASPSKSQQQQQQLMSSQGLSQATATATAGPAGRKTRSKRTERLLERLKVYDEQRALLQRIFHAPAGPGAGAYQGGCIRSDDEAGSDGGEGDAHADSDGDEEGRQAGGARAKAIRPRPADWAKEWGKRKRDLSPFSDDAHAGARGKEAEPTTSLARREHHGRPDPTTIARLDRELRRAHLALASSEGRPNRRGTIGAYDVRTREVDSAAHDSEDAGPSTPSKKKKKGDKPSSLLPFSPPLLMDFSPSKSSQDASSSSSSSSSDDQRSASASLSRVMELDNPIARGPLRRADGTYPMFGDREAFEDLWSVYAVAAAHAVAAYPHNRPEDRASNNNNNNADPHARLRGAATAAADDSMTATSNASRVPAGGGGGGAQHSSSSSSSVDAREGLTAAELAQEAEDLRDLGEGCLSARFGEPRVGGGTCNVRERQYPPLPSWARPISAGLIPSGRLPSCTVSHAAELGKLVLLHKAGEKSTASDAGTGTGSALNAASTASGAAAAATAGDAAPSASAPPASGAVDAAAAGAGSTGSKSSTGMYMPRRLAPARRKLRPGMNRELLILAALSRRSATPAGGSNGTGSANASALPKVSHQALLDAGLAQLRPHSLPLELIDLKAEMAREVPTSAFAGPLPLTSAAFGAGAGANGKGGRSGKGRLSGGSNAAGSEGVASGAVVGEARRSYKQRFVGGLWSYLLGVEVLARATSTTGERGNEGEESNRVYRSTELMQQLLEEDEEEWVVEFQRDLIEDSARHKVDLLETVDDTRWEVAGDPNAFAPEGTWALVAAPHWWSSEPPTAAIAQAQAKSRQPRRPGGSAPNSASSTSSFSASAKDAALLHPQSYVRSAEREAIMSAYYTGHYSRLEERLPSLERLLHPVYKFERDNKKGRGRIVCKRRSIHEALEEAQRRDAAQRAPPPFPQKVKAATTAAPKPSPKKQPVQQTKKKGKVQELQRTAQPASTSPSRQTNGTSSARRVSQTVPEPEEPAQSPTSSAGRPRTQPSNPARARKSSLKTAAPPPESDASGTSRSPEVASKRASLSGPSSSAKRRKTSRSSSSAAPAPVKRAVEIITIDSDDSEQEEEQGPSASAQPASTAGQSNGHLTADAGPPSQPEAGPSQSAYSPPREPPSNGPGLTPGMMTASQGPTPQLLSQRLLSATASRRASGNGTPAGASSQHQRLSPAAESPSILAAPLDSPSPSAMQEIESYLEFGQADELEQEDEEMQDAAPQAAPDDAVKDAADDESADELLQSETSGGKAQVSQSLQDNPSPSRLLDLADADGSAAPEQAALITAPAQAPVAAPPAPAAVAAPRRSGFFGTLRNLLPAQRVKARPSRSYSSETDELASEGPSDVEMDDEETDELAGPASGLAAAPALQNGNRSDSGSAVAGPSNANGADASGSIGTTTPRPAAPRSRGWALMGLEGILAASPVGRARTDADAGAEASLDAEGALGEEADAAELEAGI